MYPESCRSALLIKLWGELWRTLGSTGYRFVIYLVAQRKPSQLDKGRW